ncbi:amidase [Nocardiopsis sp. ATB16-24]|uniref:amidase n=1 Tax=Nocardiopsis sp. ATB16-24 TaxID=3019555 RepID=UPI002554BA6E|nr:amidase [Nocardiopsis sp. ATB16-24]
MTNKHETADQIRERAVRDGAEQVIRDYLVRLHTLEPRINAIASLREEAALEDARRIDTDPDLRKGPLAGVPVLVKDVHEVAGLTMSNGSRAFASYTPDFDSEAVSRLKRAGAVILGSTVMPEFGLRATTDNLLHGATRNPWKPEFGPAGSSGGAAAAVAAGLAPLALTGDGAGSGRVPAAACGIVGLKPTRGRIPWGPGTHEHWAGLAISSPMARTVRDTARLLDVVSGPMTGDPYGLPATPPNHFLEACDRRSGPLRVAWTLTPPHGQVDEGIAAAVQSTLEVFDDLPHSLVEDSPDLTGMRDPLLTIMAGNVGALVQLVGPTGLGAVEAPSLEIARQGERMTASDYVAAVNACRALAARVLEFWKEHDVLVTPTSTRPPLRVGEAPKGDSFVERWSFYADVFAFGYPFNMTGQPAITVPCGFDGNGIPVGLQLVGRPGAEDVLLDLAAQIEELRPLERVPEQVLSDRA